MAIKVHCPKGHLLHVKAEYAGKLGLFPRCKAMMQAPTKCPVPEDDQKRVPGSPRDQEEGNVYIQLYNAPISLGSSCVLTKVKICHTCGKPAPYSFSICPRCATPLSVVGDKDDEP